MLLYEQQNLAWIYWLDDIIGNLTADSLIHNILLLGLSDHNHWRGRADILYQRQGLKACHTGHHLVKDNHIVGVLGNHIYSIVTVVAGINHATAILERENMWLEQLYLVVYPKDFSVCVRIHKLSLL